MITFRSRLSLALAAALALLLGTAPRAVAGDRAGECADAAEQGQVLRDEHKLLAARASFVACAHLECPTVVRESCLEWLADVERRTPSIIVSAKTPGGRDVANVRVSVDGAARSDGVAVTALALDPGVHTIRCEADGLEAREESVVLREGEARRVVAFTLTPPPSLHVPSTPSSPSAHSLSPFAYGLGGLSILALGTFAVAAATGYAEDARLERECSPRCPSSDVDALRTRFLVADIGLVVGLLSLGGAVTLFLLDRDGARQAARVGAANVPRWR